MNLIEPSYTILSPIDAVAIYKKIEACGRTCYKSEDSITESSAREFVARLFERNPPHESVIEHEILSVRFVCDRGVSHELVRHRLASFSQESTRYCNYTKSRFGQEITFILPPWWLKDSRQFSIWCAAMSNAEMAYFGLINEGARPEQARSVLPNSLKTEIVVTANLREWRLIFKLRTARAAHPQMRQLMVPLLKELKGKMPEMFSDIVAAEE